jgi:hypothetical protein
MGVINKSYGAAKIRVEVFDEVDQRLMQLLDGVETGAFEQAPNQDTKPNLDLIEPGGMRATCALRN